MKKIIFLCVLFAGSLFLFTKMNANQSPQVLPHTISSSSTPTPPSVGLPVTISIPSLGISTAVETVGMDAQGRMGIPMNNIDTAWYKYGYRPGQKGSAVIDGHFDTPTGAPAVFYSIDRLQKGNRIIVTDTNNASYTFVVTDVVSYPFDQLPMQQIFASNDMARLNLITCDGTWNRQEHNYSNRAVVYSVLQQ